MDLFGNLPSAKNSGTSTTNPTASSTTASTSTSIHTPSLTVVHPNSNPNPNPNRLSVVESVGKNGTATALIPVALRKRPLVALTGDDSTLQQPSGLEDQEQPQLQLQPQPQQQPQQQPLLFMKKTSQPNTSWNISLTSTSTSTLSHSTRSNPFTDQEITIHKDLRIDAPPNNPGEEYEESPQLRALHDAVHLSLTHSSTTTSSGSGGTTLASTHVVSKDVLRLQPYEPHAPNDYLAIQQQRQQMSYKKNLERKAQEMLEQQKELQRQIEEERKRIESSGDIHAIVQSRITTSIQAPMVGDSNPTHKNGNTSRSTVGTNSPTMVTGTESAMPIHETIHRPMMGRGRGGIHNLPAWLVKKQMEEPTSQTQTAVPFQDSQMTPSWTTHPSNDQVNASSCTVVLENMIAPDEIDDDFLDEVGEECEIRCGKVRRIAMDDPTNKRHREPSPSHLDQVQVYVTFYDSEIAKKAVAIFHGRSFGSRTVSARIWNP